MALKTRKITNKGLEQPITAQDGTPLAGVLIEFELVDRKHIQSGTVDAITGQAVLSRKKTVTTSDGTGNDGLAIGEFEVDLWPTSRGVDPLVYRCRIPSLNVAFYAPVEDGDAPLSFADFWRTASAINSSAPDADALLAHLQDYIKHLTKSQSDALNGAALPSADNPLATLADITFAGGHIHPNMQALENINEDGEEKPTWKGLPWPGGGAGGGHVIISTLDEAMPQRSKLAFAFDVDGTIFAVSAEDDAVNDTTIIRFTFPAVVSGGNF